MKGLQLWVSFFLVALGSLSLHVSPLYHTPLPPSLSFSSSLSPSLFLLPPLSVPLSPSLPLSPSSLLFSLPSSPPSHPSSFFPLPPSPSVPLHFAGVNGDRVLALLTADRAAPGKLAGAPLHHLGPPRPVTGPAAHQLAAVRRQSRGPCPITCHWSPVPFVCSFFYPFCGRPYRCISYQRSPGSRSRDPGGRNPGREPGRGDPWQRGASPGGHGGAGLSWIRYESSGPKRKTVQSELHTKGNLKGFFKKVANAPLWRRQSAP